MKRITLVLLAVLLFSTAFAQKGLRNPAAAYCTFLGYPYSVQTDKQGNETGVCKLPDGQFVNAWDFYKGKVAQKYSYGALKGYDVQCEKVTVEGYQVERAIYTKSSKDGMEKFTLEELMEKFGDKLELGVYDQGKTPYEMAKDNPNFNYAKSTPTSFDWRSYNSHSYIGSVRDQGDCGSCYAFGATACAEGTYNLAMGLYDSNVSDFSEAYIAWCLGSMSDYSSNFSGCNGADYTYSELTALCEVGTIPESYFVYTDSDNQSCPSAASSAPKTVFSNWYRVTCSDIDAIKTAIMTYGVVDAAVYVTTSFQNYSGGIFTDSYTSCSSSPCYNTPTNHAIALVGWGYDSSTGDYWILRNSWGSSWGESGYMRIDATSARVACEVCYMVYEGSSTTAPTVTTNSISSISTTSAVGGGNITANGGATVTASGIVYSTSSNPTLTSGTVLSTSPVTTSGSYSLTMSGLTSGTTYYVRAYATNSVGTSYGTQVSFTTSSVADTQAPTAPTNLASSNVTSSSASLSWTASTDNVGVTGYRIYQNGSLLTSTTSTSYSVTGLSASTTYTFYVTAYDAAGNVSSASSTISVTTSAATVTYCTSAGSNYSYEWIASVTIGSMTNASSAAGYTDFTSVTCNLSAGTNYSVSLTPGFKSTTYNEYWKIWIDLNGDGDFTDTNEGVFDAGALSKTTVTGTMTVPSGTSAITTRMRVSMKYNASQTACETFSYGEVEDYTVVIGEAAPDTQAPTAPTGLAASSITQTTATLSWTASTDNVAVTGYSVYQNGSLLATTTSTSYSLTGLTAGTTYTYYVTAYDAAGNNSSASSTISVTTVTPDTQSPTAPTNLASSSITSSSVTLSWTASTDNVAVTGYNIYRNGSLLTTTTSTSYSVTGLSASTTYTFYVTAYDAAGNVSSASSTLSVTTLASTITYCTSKGTNYTYEWIDLVKLNTINNVTTANAGYGDFTSLSTNLSLSTSYTVYFSAGFKSTTYTEYWKVWIDYDQDGTFETTELVGSGSSKSSGTISKTFTVPSTASIGATRMRVSMKYNSSQTACETFSYGEVEDYTVVITGSSSTYKGESIEAEELGNEPSTSISVFPNPSKDNITVAPVNGLIYGTLKIYNANGALVATDLFEGEEKYIDISKFPAGIYIITVDDPKEPFVTRFTKE